MGSLECRQKACVASSMRIGFFIKKNRAEFKNRLLGNAAASTVRNEEIEFFFFFFFSLIHHLPLNSHIWRHGRQTLADLHQRCTAGFRCTKLILCSSLHPPAQHEQTASPCLWVFTTCVCEKEDSHTGFELFTLQYLAQVKPHLLLLSFCLSALNRGREFRDAVPP